MFSCLLFCTISICFVYKFKYVYSDAPEIIFEMFQEQSRHRRELERINLISGIRSRYLGTISGLIVALTGLYFSFQAIMAGHETAGAILGVGDLAALVGVFVHGSINAQKERKNKLEALTGQKTLAKPEKSRTKQS